MRPPSSLVVGFDGTECSGVAARQAVALARELGAAVTLVHVGANEDRVAAEQARLTGHGVPVSYRIAGGEVATALVAAAAATGSELVVVASHGRFGGLRLLLGSVAEHVVRSATCSVLVVRGEPVARGYRKILVGTDFSPYSLPAIQRAMTMAVDGASIELTHVWRPTADGARPAADAPAMVTAERGRAAVETYTQSRVRVSFRGFEGEPGPGLVERAAQDDSDLIAVGTHGYRGIRHLLLGSVAEHVVRHARCAVLVAR